MSHAFENRLNGLELAMRHLQTLEEERYEALSNDFSNRTESTLNLIQFLFRQCQLLRELSLHLAARIGIPDRELSALFAGFREKVSRISIQDELTSEHFLGKEERDDNAGS
jgi:hypothetical protein